MVTLRMLLCPVLALATSLGVAPSLLAGGSSVPVRVLEVNASSREHQVIRLVALARDPAVLPGSCAEVTVTVSYRRSHWWRSTGTPSTPEQHAEALRALSSAKEAGVPVQFGVMGQGLSPSPNGPCELLSHGFQVVTEASGAAAVFSFFKAP